MAVLFKTPELGEAEAGVHAEVDHLREKLAYSVQSRRWLGLLSRVSMAKAIQGSNSIEGYNVTVEDALAAVDGEPPLDATSETWAAVTGYRLAMTHVLQLTDDEYFRYSADLLRSLHFTMTNYDLAKRPGRWRPGDIFVQNEATGVRVYEGPNVAMVPELVDALVTRLNDETETPVLARAAMAHLNLVMIHPFSDGNGRMARCLQSLVLARQGIIAPQFCSIEEYLGRNRQSYYDVLAEVGAGKWNPDRDATPWVRFCLTAHYRQAITMLRRSREFNRLFDGVDEIIAKMKLPERTFFALADTAQGFRLVNSRYRAVAEVTQNLASRDLAHLCEQGLIVAHGERRGRFYTAGQLLISLREGTKEPRDPIPDPFETTTQDRKQLTLFGG